MFCIIICLSQINIFSVAELSTKPQRRRDEPELAAAKPRPG